ncbi:hypothetical protein B0H19DRAFT_1098078 [Mycena capillaripes]|nr:hypothetical protein B0H19DRAFT_1098078 [Mycena capillaripes]
MSFISNAEHLTLGEGVYANVNGNITIHNHFYGKEENEARPQEGEKPVRDRPLPVPFFPPERSPSQDTYPMMMPIPRAEEEDIIPMPHGGPFLSAPQPQLYGKKPLPSPFYPPERSPMQDIYSLMMPIPREEEEGAFTPMSHGCSFISIQQPQLYQQEPQPIPFFPEHFPMPEIDPMVMPFPQEEEEAMSRGGPFISMPQPQRYQEGSSLVPFYQ